MLMNLRDVRKQKGQGIVEYALLLAFILGIAIAMQGSGIDNAIANTFARVAHALGVETEQDKWATADINSIMDDKDSAASRLASDRDFLTNIGKHFIGMKRSDVEDVLATTNTSSVLLGNFLESVDENGNLVTEFSTELRKEGTIPKTSDLYQWGANDTLGYDSSKRYLVSDYALHNISNTTSINGKDVITGNGIKIMSINYDGSGADAKVTSIRIAVNPNTGFTGEGYQRKDLDVTVK